MSSSQSADEPDTDADRPNDHWETACPIGEATSNLASWLERAIAGEEIADVEIHDYSDGSKPSPEAGN